jgi:hypothetical protein
MIVPHISSVSLSRASRFVAMFSVLLCPSLKAAKDAEISPILVKAGKELKSETFSENVLGPDWSVAKGDWQPKEGILVGREKAEDKHAAVCALNLKNQNSIIRFSFCFRGSKSLALSLNHAKGHLFRLTLNPETGLQLLKDKDKADPNSKGGILGKADAKFEVGTWHTVQMEMLDDKVTVTTDGKLKIEGADPALKTAKTGYRFVTQGESVEIAAVKVWETAP